MGTSQRHLPVTIIVNCGDPGTRRINEDPGNAGLLAARAESARRVALATTELQEAVDAELGTVWLASTDHTTPEPLPDEPGPRVRVYPNRWEGRLNVADLFFDTVLVAYGWDEATFRWDPDACTVSVVLRGDPYGTARSVAAAAPPRWSARLAATGLCCPQMCLPGVIDAVDHAGTFDAYLEWWAAVRDGWYADRIPFKWHADWTWHDGRACPCTVAQLLCAAPASQLRAATMVVDELSRYAERHGDLAPFTWDMLVDTSAVLADASPSKVSAVMALLLSPGVVNMSADMRLHAVHAAVA